MNSAIDYQCKQIETGICSCVGMIGLTLGAGIGRQQGTNGLVLDALLSARVVTASGEILEASETSNPDLFWAIRGAGQNFGIVSSATYQLHPLSGTFTSIDLAFPAHLNSSFFHALADFNLTEKWAIASYIFYDTATGEVFTLPLLEHTPTDNPPDRPKSKLRLPRPKERRHLSPRPNPRPRAKGEEHHRAPLEPPHSRGFLRVGCQDMYSRRPA